MGWTRSKIYEVELRRALDDGLEYAEAEIRARERTEEKYWELVDEGRARGKDR